jgi:hypothetical protein
MSSTDCTSLAALHSVVLYPCPLDGEGRGEAYIKRGCYSFTYNTDTRGPGQDLGQAIRVRE